MIDDSIQTRYGQTINLNTKEEASTFLNYLVEDMMSWSCWCVTPPRNEAERIEKKNIIWYASLQDDTTKSKILSLFE